MKDENMEIKLVPGDEGIFDVFCDGKLVYSRAETGQLPDENELKEKLKS
jgi:selT/selW/selH-like putative selenoprotein